jgi:hypothetical protein
MVFSMTLLHPKRAGQHIHLDLYLHAVYCYESKNTRILLNCKGGTQWLSQNAASVHSEPSMTIIPDHSSDGSGNGTSNGAPDGNRILPGFQMMREKRS